MKSLMAFDPGGFKVNPVMPSKMNQVVIVFQQNANVSVYLAAMLR